jgi:uncharacterized protein YecT (DUF1311 family)
MKKLLVISLLCLLGACSKIPDCGDQKSFDLLSEIMLDKLTTNVDPKLSEFIRKNTKFQFEGITITSDDEKLGKKTCKGTAIFQGNNEDTKKILELIKYPALDRAVSLRWELLTDLFTQEDYLKLQTSRAEAEKYQDADLVNQIDARLALDNVKPVDIQRAMRLANTWVNITPTAIALRNSTGALLIKEGMVKFPIEYKIERLEDKKNPFQISARFDEKALQGIFYFDVIIYAYNQQMESKSTLISSLKNPTEPNPSSNKEITPSTVAEPTLPEIYQTIESGNLAKAEQMVSTVLQKHPDSAKAYYVAAEVFLKEGKLEDARNALAKAEKLAPGLPFAKPELVQILKKQLSAGIQPQTQATTSPTASNTDTPFTPSFDCTKASSGVERLICSDRDLSKLDVELNVSYLKAREKSINPKQLQAEQVTWIKSSRNACSDKACLTSAYKQRISEINK